MAEERCFQATTTADSDEHPAGDDNDSVDSAQQTVTTVLAVYYGGLEAE